MNILPDTTIIPYLEKKPLISDKSLICSGARIIGDVHIGQESSVWFNTVIRGDVNYVRIGNRTNIQDNSMLHVTDGGRPCIIGNEVTVGHSATIHAATIKDRCLIGMGATILDDAVIQEDSIVAAGSIVSPGKTFPKKSLIMGAPARVKRELTEKEIEHLKESAQHYVNIASNY